MIIGYLVCAFLPMQLKYAKHHANFVVSVVESEKVNDLTVLFG